MSYSSRKLAELIDAHRAEALGPFFRKLARATVAATALSLAACESPGTSVPLDAGPPGPSRAGAEDTYCVDVDGRTQIDLLAGVELDATPDSVSAIQQFWSSERFFFGRRGEICEGAPDVSLCRANFSSLGPGRCQGSCRESYAATAS